MKTITKRHINLAFCCMAMGLIFIIGSCKKADINPGADKVHVNRPDTSFLLRPGLYQLNFDGLRSDSGFAYKISYVINGGDSDEQPDVSTMRLFENGVELFPPHSQHADIRKYGHGRFSHWMTTLYFSTSDNTDPVTNGREYTYTLNGLAYPPDTSTVKQK